MPRLSTLNSWKEIADYLGRSVRTVQRWEARFGLPVRHRAGKRTSVFAIEAELDSWLQTRSKFRAAAHDLPATTYSLIFQSVPFALGVVNDHRQWVEANRAACELLGYANEELTHLRLDDVIIETERGSLAISWETMLARGKVSSNLLVRSRDRQPQWVQFHGYARVVPGFHLVTLGLQRNSSRLIGSVYQVDVQEDSGK